jgi:hypothetical protein
LEGSSSGVASPHDAGATCPEVLEHQKAVELMSSLPAKNRAMETICGSGSSINSDLRALHFV